MLAIRLNTENIDDRRKANPRTRRCNLCKRRFSPNFRYQLFCGKCGAQDDIFFFSEWFPKFHHSNSIATVTIGT